MAEAPPVHVTLEIAEAATGIESLLQLDAAWTEAADRSSELTERDRQALLMLGNELDARVSIVERYAATLQRVCESHGEWLNERLSEALASDQFDSSQQDDIRRILKVAGDDFATRGAAIAESIVQQVPVEREELKGKMPALRGDGPVVTDFSHEFQCNLVAGGIFTCLALCPKSAGVGCIGAGALLLMGHFNDC
jgi:hypothetical protein